MSAVVTGTGQPRTVNEIDGILALSNRNELNPLGLRRRLLTSQSCQLGRQLLARIRGVPFAILAGLRSGIGMASVARESAVPPLPDPGRWVDEHGDILFRFAMLRVRNRAVAEDLVQDTLLAGLQSRDKFGGASSERTWLIGIMKHKVIDHFRSLSRQIPLDNNEGIDLVPKHLFAQSGEWVDHWAVLVEPDAGHWGPIEWRANPEELCRQTDFCNVLDGCLGPLPPRVASAFTLREVDELPTDEICEVLGISHSNLWVMLHRARAHLRNCIEMKWFKPRGRRA